jgi:hypothetical protein
MGRIQNKNETDQKYIKNYNGKTCRETPLGDIGVDGRMILKWILVNHGVRVWIGPKRYRFESSGGVL